MFTRVKPGNQIKISLLDCIGKSFYDMYWYVIQHTYTYFNLTGGRGSLKSSFISIMIVLLIMYFPNIHAVIYRKVADTIETSTYAQICWAIDKLGVSDKWACKKSPYRCIYLKTGQEIIFKGLDKAEKSKSIKVKFGYIGILWFEELDEYKGDAEIRKVQQSVIRGGQRFWIFKSMNPPKSRANWANTYIEQSKLKPDTYTSHTTYQTVDVDWLGQQFIDDAEWLKEINPNAYDHEYLGKPIGNGTEVFDNIELRQITDEEISRFDRIYNGVDWGWYPDPYHFGKMHYDNNRGILYIFAEYRTNRTTNIDTANHLLETGLIRKKVDVVTCDSAEHKSTADYRAYGINARDAEKGPDSVRYGMKWLQSRVKIVIDPIRCPYTADEFSHYEYELDKEGNPTSNYPDENNHSIDMTRYAMEQVWKRKGR